MYTLEKYWNRWNRKRNKKPNALVVFVDRNNNKSDPSIKIVVALRNDKIFK